MLMLMANYKRDLKLPGAPDLRAAPAPGKTFLLSPRLSPRTLKDPTKLQDYQLSVLTMGPIQGEHPL